MNPKSIPMVVVGSIVILQTILPSTSFIPILQHHSTTTTSPPNSILVPPLHAKKKSTSKSNSKSGGGFGTHSLSSQQHPPKTRVVSGHTGSGTKPLRDAANTFDKLQTCSSSSSICHDMYVRSPLNDPTLYWFVGKVATCTNSTNLHGTVLPTKLETALSQKRLILEYAARQLRPQNLGGPYQSNLELWMAPGNSEMDAVQNKVSLEKVVGSAKDIRMGFSIKDVGYNPEIYVGDEIVKGGLRIVRDENGLPVKPVFSINDGVS